MRREGQVKQGFYPTPPGAIAEILKHIRGPSEPPGDKQSINLLDPCAGEGKALASLAEGLSRSGPSPANEVSSFAGASVNLHAVELNRLRSERIAAAHPDWRLLGPCSFDRAAITPASMGFIYLNPPFDDEYGGGGREELAFLRLAIPVLASGGVLCLVCPVNQVWGMTGMCELIDIWFDHVEVYLFPDAVRNYRECVVFGRKREKALSATSIQAQATKGCLTGRAIRYTYSGERGALDNLPRLGNPAYDRWNLAKSDKSSIRADLNVWEIPYTKDPHRFLKTGYSDEELSDVLATSPLYDSMLAVKPEADLKRPPMSLNEGHTSLLLLSGLLDGYVPSRPPHVVRGHITKVENLREVKQYETPSGVAIEKRIYSESPVPICRAVWQDGTIRTFGEPVVEAETVIAESDQESEESE